MGLVKLVRHHMHCWGQDAALRHAKKQRVPFVAAYAAVFDRLPRVI